MYNTLIILLGRWYENGNNISWAWPHGIWHSCFSTAVTLQHTYSKCTPTREEELELDMWYTCSYVRTFTGILLHSVMQPIILWQCVSVRGRLNLAYTHSHSSTDKHSHDDCTNACILLMFNMYDSNCKNIVDARNVNAIFSESDIMRTPSCDLILTTTWVGRGTHMPLDSMKC